MKFLLNLFYLLLLTLLFPWLVWRVALQSKNRRGWRQKLFGWAPRRNSSKPCAWIHAVSVGEINLLIPFVQQFRQQFPDFEIAISTTTETGFELAQKRFPHDLVFFCPADFSWAVENTIRRIKPNILILAELEIWPNLISICTAHRVPVALINGRISAKSYRGYRRIRFLIGPVIKRIQVAAVQTQAYADRLIQLGAHPDRVHVTGNIKFDSVEDIVASQKNQALAELAQLSESAFVFLAGSTQENEDVMAISVYQTLHAEFPQLRLVLVPRHPARAERIASLLEERQLRGYFRSELDKPDQRTGQGVLIVDVIGELSDWWGRADVGYVGGSMGRRGGQNMIEPAAWGIPISFGPNTENFRDVVDLLLAERAAVVVKNEAELQEFVRSALENQTESQKMGRRGQFLVSQQQGASIRTVALLTGPLSSFTSDTSDTVWAA